MKASRGGRRPPPLHPLLDLLAAGDRRSLRGVPEAVDRVRADPGLFPVLMEGMESGKPLVRMRSADAMEKITHAHADWLAPYRGRLLDLAESARQQELRWHLAQLLPRLDLGAADRRKAVKILDGYLEDKSSIVRTFALQALADLSAGNSRLRKEMRGRLERYVREGTPAMRARARKLLAKRDVPGKPAPSPGG